MPRDVKVPKRKVWLIAEMVKDDEGESYFLNEVVAVYGNEPAAEEESKRLAAIGGTYSIFEHEVKHGFLM